MRLRMLIDVVVAESEITSLAHHCTEQVEAKLFLPTGRGGTDQLYFGRLVGAQETHEPESH